MGCHEHHLVGDVDQPALHAGPQLPDGGVGGRADKGVLIREQLTTQRHGPHGGQPLVEEVQHRHGGG
ncbi:MAG: hypothetical protein QOH17_2031 [Pseudonocardiales bacterium]|nr:hypothetical protein [Pseudonocardiales bacterium]